MAAPIFYNVLSGQLSADPGAGGTTLNSAAFANMPAIVAPDTMRLTLDPDGVSGAPEIVLVTAHTAAATSCTVTRGQEVGFGGVAGHAHPITTVWRHSATRLDWEEMPFRKVTTKGDLIAATGVNAVARLAAGANDTRLVADSAQASGLRYAPDTELKLVAAKGDIVAGSANDTVAVLTAGANDTRLVADSSQATGLRWAADTEHKIVAAKGDLVAGTANDTVAVLTAGANDTRLVADSGQATGLRYAPDTELKLVAAKGDLITGTANDTVAVTTVGANDTRLVADSTQGGGVRWAPDTELKLIAAKGDLLVGTANDTIAVKSVGADGSFVMADAASAGGVKWNVGALTNWVPGVTQGVGVTVTVTYASWQRIGRQMFADVHLVVTGAGSAGSPVIVGVPLTIHGSLTTQSTIGSGTIIDASAAQAFSGQARPAPGSTSVKFHLDGFVTEPSYLGTAAGAFTAALAAGDIITMNVRYETIAD